MSPDPSFDPAKIDVRGAVTLAIARRVGANMKGYRVAMHTDVANELRTICANTIAALRSRKPVEYADDLDFEAETQYLLVPTDMLVAHRPESRRGRRKADDDGARTQVLMDPSASAILATASSLPELPMSELTDSEGNLRDRSYVFYAAVVGDASQSRIAFVDRWNPYKAALSGRVTTWFGDRLRKVEGPLLVFERSFDMVVTDSAIAVLDPQAFEIVFRDIDAMVERVPGWTRAAISALPFDKATVDRIEALAEHNKRLVKQIRGMYERGAFSKRITVHALRKEMVQQKLDVGRLIKSGKLTLDDDDIPTILKLVDEKLSVGWHTGTPWEMGTRVRRS
jgi:hypothetical protein